MLTTTANGSSATFKMTDAKFYVPVVTLSTEYNAKLAKQLSERFKRSVYWKKYKITGNKIVEIIDGNAQKHIRYLLDSSYQEVKWLFVLTYDNAADNNQVPVDSY